MARNDGFLYCAGCGKRWVEKEDYTKGMGIYCEECETKDYSNGLYCSFCGRKRDYNEKIALSDKLGKPCLKCMEDNVKIDFEFLNWIQRKISSEQHDAGYRYILRELVQNADDLEPSTRILVIRFTEEALEVSNDGRAFTTYDEDTYEIGGDMQEVQNIWKSKKEKEVNSTGYHGTGFQTVFALTNFPEIHSSGYSVTLDPTKSEQNFYEFEDIEDSGFSSPYGEERGVLFRFPWRDEKAYNLKLEDGCKPFKEREFPIFNLDDVRDTYESWKEFLEDILITCNNIEKIRISLEVGDDRRFYQAERDFTMRRDDLPNIGKVVTIDKGEGEPKEGVFAYEGFKYNKSKSERTQDGDLRRYYWCSNPLKDKHSTKYITLKENKKIIKIDDNPEKLPIEELKEKSISKRTDINIFFPIFPDIEPDSKETNDYVRSVIPTPTKGSNFFKISAHMFITQDRASIDTNGIKGEWLEKILENIRMFFPTWFRKFVEELKNCDSIDTSIKQKIILDNLPSENILEWFDLNTLEYTHPKEGRKKRTKYWGEESGKILNKIKKDIELIKSLDNWREKDWLTPVDLYKPQKKEETLLMEKMGIPHVHDELNEHPRFKEILFDAPQALDPSSFMEIWEQFKDENSNEQGHLEMGEGTDGKVSIDREFVSALIEYCLVDHKEELNDLGVIPNSEGILKPRGELKKAPERYCLLRKVIPKEKRIHLDIESKVKDQVKRVKIKDLMLGVDENREVFQETENIRMDFYNFLDQEEDFNPSKIDVQNYHIIIDDEGKAREPKEVKYSPLKLLEKNKSVFNEANIDINWCSENLIRKYKNLMNELGVDRPNYKELLSKNWDGVTDRMKQHQKVIFEGIISTLDESELSGLKFVPCQGKMSSPEGRLLDSTERISMSSELFDSFLTPIDNHIFDIFFKSKRKNEVKEKLKRSGAMETNEINILKRISIMWEKNIIRHIEINSEDHTIISKIVYHACKTLSEGIGDDEIETLLKDVSEDRFVPASYRDKIILCKPGPLGHRTSQARYYDWNRVMYINKNRAEEAGITEWVLNNIKTLSMEDNKKEEEISHILFIPKLVKSGVASLFSEFFLDGRDGLCLFKKKDLINFIEGNRSTSKDSLHELRKDLLEILLIRTKASIGKKENDFTYSNWKDSNPCFFDSNREWLPAKRFVLNLTPELEALDYKSLHEELTELDDDLLKILGVKRSPDKETVIKHLKEWSREYSGGDDLDTRRKLGDTILYMLMNRFELDIREEVEDLEFIPVYDPPEFPLRKPSECIINLSIQEEDIEKILGHDFSYFLKDDTKIMHKRMIERVKEEGNLDTIKSKCSQIGLRKSPELQELKDTIKRRQPLPDDERGMKPPENVFDEIEDKITKEDIDEDAFEGLKYYNEGDWYNPDRIFLDEGNLVPDVFKKYYIFPDNHKVYLESIGSKRGYGIKDALKLIKEEKGITSSEPRSVWEGLKELYRGEEGLDDYNSLNIFAPKENPYETIGTENIFINNINGLMYKGWIAGKYYIIDEENDDKELLSKFGALNLEEIDHEMAKKILLRTKDNSPNLSTNEGLIGMISFLFSKLVEACVDKGVTFDSKNMHVPVRMNDERKWNRIDRSWIPDHSKWRLFCEEGLPIVDIKLPQYNRWLKFLKNQGAKSLKENIEEDTHGIEEDNTERNELQEFRFKEMSKHIPKHLDEDVDEEDFVWLSDISVKYKSMIDIIYKLKHPILDEEIQKQDRKGFFYDEKDSILYISPTGPEKRYKELAREICEISKNQNPTAFEDIERRSLLRSVTYMLSTSILSWIDYEIDNLPEDQQLPPELFEIIEMSEENYIEMRENLKEKYGFCQLCRNRTPSEEGYVERMRSIISLRGGRYTGKPDKSDSIANYLWLCPTCYTLYDRGFVKIQPLENNGSIVDQLKKRKKVVELEKDWKNGEIKRLDDFCEWKIERLNDSNNEYKSLSDMIFLEREHYLKVLNNLIEFYSKRSGR